MMSRCDSTDSWAHFCQGTKWNAPSLPPSTWSSSPMLQILPCAFGSKNSGMSYLFVRALNYEQALWADIFACSNVLFLPQEAPKLGRLCSFASALWESWIPKNSCALTGTVPELGDGRSCAGFFDKGPVDRKISYLKSMSDSRDDFPFMHRNKPYSKLLIQIVIPAPESTLKAKLYLKLSFGFTNDLSLRIEPYGQLPPKQ